MVGTKEDNITTSDEKDKQEKQETSKASTNSTAQATQHVQENDSTKANSTQKASTSKAKKAKGNEPIPRPAILLTGATHSRELITVQMNMYTALKLLHQGIVNKDEKF